MGISLHHSFSCIECFVTSISEVCLFVVLRRVEVNDELMLYDSHLL